MTVYTKLLTGSVINKNPFLYKYELTTPSTSLSGDAALLSFLKVFSTLFSTLITSSGGTPETTPRTFSAKAETLSPNLSIENCSDARARAIYERLLNDIRLFGKQKDLLIADFQALSVQYEELKKLYGQMLEKFSKRQVKCVELCNEANSLLRNLENNENDLTADFNSLKINLEKLKRDADGIDVRINDFVATYPECQPVREGSGELRGIQPDVQRTSYEATQRLGILAEMNASYKKILEIKQYLTSLASRPELFQEKTSVGPFDVPTNVTVTLKYKSVDAAESEKFKDMVIVKLNFGGEARFVVSGGIVYGLLDRPEFKPGLGLERDRQGNIIPNQAPTIVIGLTERVNKRVTPILMLHTRVFELSRTSDLFFSFGITSPFTETSKIEYLIGPSVNFFDRRVFFTYGLYAGKTQRLNPGLYVGIKVDSALDATKLVRNDFIWKSGFAVTYKIR